MRVGWIREIGGALALVHGMIGQDASKVSTGSFRNGINVVTLPFGGKRIKITYGCEISTQAVDELISEVRGRKSDFIEF